MSREAAIDVAERTVRTLIQVAAAAALALWVEAGSLAEIDWSVLWQTVVYAVVLALLMSLAGTRRGDPNTASYLDQDAS